MIKKDISRPINGLFILFEGIDETIFDAQVATHVKEMGREGINFEIWTFATNRKLFKKSSKRKRQAEQLAECKIRLFWGVYRYIPFSDAINSILLLFIYLLLKPSIDFVHARSDYSASVCGYIFRLFKIPVVWDCRGDALSEFDNAFRPKSLLLNILKKIYMVSIKWHSINASRSCALAIFVSKELYKKIGFKVLKENAYIIPSTASSEIFHFSSSIRNSTRQMLGLSDDDIVLMYSGGMVKYQNFPAYLEYFDLVRSINEKVKLLILTPSIEKALNYLSKFRIKEYLLMSARFEEMNTYYNAADYGMLFRIENEVNNVASPTKFGEYSLAGLPIIMNKSVPQAIEFALQIGNFVNSEILLKNGALAKLPTDERIKISNCAKGLISREKFNHHYLSLYKNLSGRFNLQHNELIQ